MNPVDVEALRWVKAKRSSRDALCVEAAVMGVDAGGTVMAMGDSKLAGARVPLPVAADDFMALIDTVRRS